MKQEQPTSAAIRVASRSSRLALVQVDEVFSALPHLNYKVQKLLSYGDMRKDISLVDTHIPDFFTREIDEALRNGTADVAVHSAKDLPFPLADDLELAALTRPADQSDALVSRNNLPLESLPPRPRIGTSSLLRKAELLKLRPDAEIVSIRGTIEERIAQIDADVVDAVIVATCALQRLNLHHRIAEVLPFDAHPLQGVLAVVIKAGNDVLKQLFAPIDNRANYGTVSLVGFGPGDPGLLTRRGFEHLQKANVIFHDDLLDQEFLHQFVAQKVYVGKRRNNHSMEQEGINRLLYDAALNGQRVVRLKGGDPMIFAHGGEEVDYLRQSYVNVEVVPGITTALAAAASSQIPLTHRDVTAAVTLVSGHNPSKIDFSGTQTVVVYMGASKAKELARRAMEQGRSAQTPVACIAHVSKPNERRQYFTLAQLAETDPVLETPLIMLVGDVVRAAPDFKIDDVQSTVWCTGTYPDLLPNRNVLHAPLISISKMKEYSELKAHFSSLNGFDWLVFTSRHTVRIFFEELFEAGHDVRALGRLRVASVGKITSNELRKWGVIPDLQPEEESSEGLLAAFEALQLQGARVLIPRSNLALPILPEGLTKLGHQVSTTIVYENVLPQPVQIPEAHSYEAVLFSSPSCVENFVQLGQTFHPNKTYIYRGRQTLKKLEAVAPEGTKMEQAHKDAKSTKDFRFAAS